MVFETSNGRPVSSSTSNAEGRDLFRLDASGDLKISQETSLFEGGFYPFVSARKWRTEQEGPTSSRQLVNNTLKLNSGTSIGYYKMQSDLDIAYLPGTGMLLRYSVVFDDLGESGNRRGFGYFLKDTGFILELEDDVFKFKIIRGGSVVYTKDATDWDIPYNLDDMYHIYDIQFQWFGIGDIRIFVDDQLYLTVKWRTIEAEVHLGDPDLSMYVFNENTSVTSSDHSIRVGCCAALAEGKKERNFNNHFSLSLPSRVSLSGGTYSSILALHNYADRDNIVNKRIINIKTIIVSSQRPGWFRITKNPVITGGTHFYPEAIEDPFFTPTVSLNASNATGGGYTDGDSVEYQISVIGSTGETIPSATSSSIAVGTPAKKVDLSWDKHPFGLAYSIYRRVNGSGNFLKIAEVPLNEPSYTDNAIIAGTKQPEVSSNARGDSFAKAHKGHTASGGSYIMVGRINDTNEVIDFVHDTIILKPEEAIDISVYPANVGDFSASITWQEILH